MTLEPQAKKLLESLNKNSPLPSMITVEEKRAQLAVFKDMVGKTKDIAKIENRKIPVNNGEIKIRIYTPQGDGPFPILIYLHGGGWVTGDLEIGNTICQNIAHRSGFVVVSVDYRLAPEYKFPIPVKDCLTAAEWVEKHSSSFNGDPSKIAIGGDSAGGNLATVVSMIARDQGYPSIKYQILLYPATNLDFDTKSYKENAEGYILTRDGMIWYAQQYLNSKEERENPFVSPLLAEDLGGLPPALIITAGYDVLRDEGALYASRLIQSNVDVEYICYQGMVHGFLWMSGVIDQGNQAIKHIANRLHLFFNEN